MMSYQFESTESKAQPVLSIRTTTSVKNLPAELGKAFTTIGSYIEELGETPTDAPFAAYYNMDMENLDVEIGFPVSKELEGRDNIKAGVIPEGNKAFYMYKGPYTKMETVYNEMSKWMQGNNLVPTGVVYEHYYNSPMEVPESELLTKIVFLLK
jgi:effector-binding domain-containing protein